MSWELKLAIRGDLQRYYDAEAKAAAKAVTSVIRRRVNLVKKDIRRQLKKAGLGERLGKAVRGETIPPKGASIEMRGRVYSKAIVKRPGGRVDLITLFDEGDTVRPRAGKKFLAIPVNRGSRRDPGYSNLDRLQFVPFRNRKGGLLVRKQTVAGAVPDSSRGFRIETLHRRGDVVAILVPQVRIKKRISVDRAYQKGIRDIDQLVANAWEREARKAIARL